MPPVPLGQKLEQLACAVLTALEPLPLQVSRARSEGAGISGARYARR